MATYSAPTQLLGGTEFQVKRSWRSILGYLITTLFSLLVIYTLIRVFGSATLPTEIPVLRSLTVHWLLIVPLGLVIETCRVYHDDLYVFETTKVTHRGGRLSLTYAVPVIYYRDVRSITVRQSIWGRIFDYGTIEVSTAAQGETEMYIEGVCSPDELAHLIDELRVLNRDRYLAELSRKQNPGEGMVSDELELVENAD